MLHLRQKYDTTEDLKGGTFLLNCPWTVEELNAPACQDEADLWPGGAPTTIIDACTKLARGINLGSVPITSSRALSSP